LIFAPAAVLALSKENLRREVEVNRMAGEVGVDGAAGWVVELERKLEALG